MTQDNATPELREAAKEIILAIGAEPYGVNWSPALRKVEALLQVREQQLLTELLGEAIKVDRPFSAGGTANESLFEAVPVSVIEKYREGL